MKVPSSQETQASFPDPSRLKALATHQILWAIYLKGIMEFNNVQLWGAHPRMNRTTMDHRMYAVYPEIEKDHTAELLTELFGLRDMPGRTAPTLGSLQEGRILPLYIVCVLY